MRILFTTLIFSLFSLSQLVAQGTMHKQNGHFTAHLDFLGNYPVQNSAGHIKGSSLDYGNGFTNTDQKKYNEKGVTVYGLVKSAVLKVDWWALFGEPTELYQFEWISSGYYDISFNSKGKLVTTKINKTDLAKYPDLLKRFNNLAPSEMAFEIKWKMGKPTEADIKKLEEKYTLDANYYSGLGNNNLNINRLYKTDIKSSSLLFEPTGETPFATPTIRSRKDFLGISQEDHTDTDIKRILSWWNFCQTHTIDGFKIVKQDWPIDEMKAIAEKYLAYENGEEEPTPKEQIAKAEEKNKNTQAYAKDDFWGDAVEEESNAEVFNESNEVGIKRKNKIIRKYDASKFEIYATENKKIFKLVNKCLYDNSIHIMLVSFLNDRGELIKINDKLEFYDTPESRGESAIFSKISESDVIRELLYVHSFNRNFPSKIKSTYAEVNNAILNYDNSGGVSSSRYFFQIMELEKLYVDFNTMRIIKKETVFRPFYKKWTQKNGTKIKECY